jgi:ubiquinone/menaquinone biosynthesis C-methylase UbiE
MNDESLREIVNFYTETNEESRLGVGSSQLEFGRTKELIRRFLPIPPAQVIDVGGASGLYAFWLASLGYQVHLIDATPRLVDVARQQQDDATHRLESIAVGDARHLSFDETSVDAVLVFGPLYHLTEQSERLAALTEARRVLRPNGVVFVAGISRYAGTLDGLALHPTLDEHIVAIRHRALADGQYQNDTGDPRYFTTAYFHRPEDLREELNAAGFGTVRVFGVEGPGWLLADFEARWADPASREGILRVARLLEEEPSILGASAHLLGVGCRAVDRRSA